MEDRIVKLEEFAAETRERLSRIETRLEQTATKADLQEAIASMIKWVAAIAVMLGATAITVMTFVLNNATQNGRHAGADRHQRSRPTAGALA